MIRFYLKDLNTINYSFILKDKEIIHQISKVLRSKIGDKVIFFDGLDLYDYIFEIKEIGKKEIFLEQVGRVEKKSEINFEINLFQGIPNKLDKIESIIKNGTQIGVTNFLFFKGERSQKLNLTDKKLNRLNKIILESVEQSDRNFIPTLIIGDKINFEKLEGKNIFFHTKSRNSKHFNEIDFKNTNCQNGSKIINLFVGPEGGFSDIEVGNFEKNKFERVYLGNRILRTELVGVISAFYIIQNNL